MMNDALARMEVTTSCCSEEDEASEAEARRGRGRGEGEGG
jgi:hypothetical protein